jgi:hypothetical protein
LPPHSIQMREQGQIIAVCNAFSPTLNLIKYLSKSFSAFD